MLGALFVGALIGLGIKAVHDELTSGNDESSSDSSEDSSDRDERPSGYPGITIRHGHDDGGDPPD